MDYEDYQNASADMSRSDYPQLNWDAIFKKDKEATLKEFKLDITLKVADSADIEDIVSDLQDGLSGDDVKHLTVKYVKNGTLETSEFENEDFEE